MAIYDKLFDWQKNILDKIKDKDSYGLFLDMGLGKTIMSLALAEYHRCEKVIVISINAKATEDASVKGSWFDWAKYSDLGWKQIYKWTKTFSNVDDDMLLINYESLFKRVKEKRQKVILQDNIESFIKSCKGKRVCIIVDESHKLKNLQSQQTCAIFKMKTMLSRLAASINTYLLTGTPFTTGYVDLYAQLKMLGCPMTKGEFVDNYCVRDNRPGLLGWQQPIIGYKNVDDLFKLVHQYAITIKSDEVINLPRQIFVKHKYPMTEEFRMFVTDKDYDQSIAHLANKLHVNYQRTNLQKKINNPFYRNIAYPSFDWIADTPGSFFLRSRQLSIGFQGNTEKAIWYDRTRLNQLKAFLERNEDNYVLFYNYTPEMLEIYEICDQLGYNIDVYCGEIKSEVHYNRFANLSEAEKLTCKKNILLANFQSGSTGKNWQEYNKCIIFSIPVFKDWQQGIKRVHRSGQKFDVIYHIFAQDNWLDNGMRSALDKCIEYDEKLFESAVSSANNGD